MAYGIMGSMPDSRMLTYRTKKDVKAVYFDGTSASLMGEGTMAQMVLLYNGTENIPKRGGWGPPRGRRPDHDKDGEKKDRGEDPPRRPPPGHWNPLEDEYFRARGLCKWLVSRGLGGPGWGYEGVVRMNAGFEVIWCDFESPSLKLVSNLNVSVPLLQNVDSDRFQGSRQTVFETQAMLRANEDEGPHGPGMTSPLEPFRYSSTWFWFAAAAKRYFGESRIKVDACGLFSFYESELQYQSSARIEDDASRLNLTAAGKWESPSEDVIREYGLDKLKKRRRQHRLDSVEEKDGDFMLRSLEARLKNALDEDGCNSGVDWHYIAKEIVTQYSNELETLLQYLKADIPTTAGNEENLRSWLQSSRTLTHWFLLPFMEYPPGRPYDKENLAALFALESPLAQTTLERCQTQYNTEDQVFDDEGSVLYQAIKDTIAGICSTVVHIGLGVEYHWLLNFNSVPSSDLARRTQAYDELLDDAQAWRRKLEELMAWLGWAEKWTTGAESCGPGNVPYVPMWPVAGFRRRRGPPAEHRDIHLEFAAPRGGWGGSELFLWHAVCVNASSYPPEEWE